MTTRSRPRSRIAATLGTALVLGLALAPASTADEGPIEDALPDDLPTLAEAFDNVGITSAGNHELGQLAHTGGSLAAEALAQAGITPGEEITVGELTFPGLGQPDEPNDAVASGQTIALAGQGSELGFVHLSTYGDATGDGTVHYTDGSSDAFTLASADYYYNRVPAGGEVIAQMSARHTQAGVDRRTVSLYASAVTIDPRKTVEAVTLPHVSDGLPSTGEPAMYVFSMAIGGPDITVSPGNTTYHVDCSASAPGDGSEGAPWNSVDQASHVSYGPGDRVLFRGGVECRGTFKPLGSGSADAPVVVDSSGDGRGLINGDGGRTALHLVDLSHWTVRGLEITNPADDRKLRSGVQVDSISGAAKAGITLTDLHVHHVAGWGNKTGSRAGEFANSAGIQVRVAGATINGTGGPIHGLSITDNLVNDTGGGGIKISGRPYPDYHTDVYVGHNEIREVGGDGIVMHGSDAPLVEYNEAWDLGLGAYPFEDGNFAGMWPINARNPVFQYNSVVNSYPSIFDSTAWDCDGGIVGTCLYQYNYSQGNAGGFYLNCLDCTELGGTTADQVLRYNVSQDECTFKILENSPLYLHDNTFWCTDGALKMEVRQAHSEADRMTIANNVFVAPGGSWDAPAGTRYTHNLYAGGVPAAPGDDAAVLELPGLTAPGSGRGTLASLDAYRLTEGSPALGAGLAGVTDVDEDVFGNPVPAGGPVNIGADEGAGVPVAPAAGIRAAYNNVGTSDDRNASTGGATVAGESFSAQALADAGVTAGATIEARGATFTWDGEPGLPDNVKAAGQRVALDGRGGRLVFLGYATGGDASGTGTVTYADGVTEEYTLTLDDWRDTASDTGATLVAGTAYSNGRITNHRDPATGRRDASAALWAADVPLRPGVAIAEITLPEGNPLATDGLHVVDVATAPGRDQQRWSAARVTATAPGAVEPGGTADVEVTVTNTTDRQLTRVEVTADVPDGWTATVAGAGIGRLAPGATATATVTVTAPADAATAVALTPRVRWFVAEDDASNAAFVVVDAG
jgi:hypothetical protein